MTKPLTDLALPTTEVNASSGPLDWKALVMAGLLALGFSSTFLSPVLRIQAPQRSGGQILGDSGSRPLTVPVTVTNGQTMTIQTRPASGTVTDALARAAAQLGGSLMYSSRGSSIYLQEYLKTPNDATGQWKVELNGLPLTDLSRPGLTQGDVLTIERQRP